MANRHRTSRKTKLVHSTGFILFSLFVALNTKTHRTFSTTELYLLSSKEQRKRRLVRNDGFDPLLHSPEWDMSPVVIPEYKLIFFTQPKVGCTVFKQLFRRMMGKMDWKAENCCGYLPWNPATNGLIYLKDYSPSEARRMLYDDPTYVKAIFVRDPVTRFLSAYLDKGRQRNSYFLQRKCGVWYNAVRSWHRHNRNHSLTIEDFYVIAKNCDNPHWRPQSRRLPQSKDWNDAINFVGYMETIQADSERLLRQIGAWDDFGRTGWGGNNHTNDSIFHGSLGRKHATSASSHRYEHVSPELEAMLRTELYAQDYQHPVFLRYKMHSQQVHSL